MKLEMEELKNEGAKVDEQVSSSVQEGLIIFP